MKIGTITSQIFEEKPMIPINSELFYIKPLFSIGHLIKEKLSNIDLTEETIKNVLTLEEFDFFQNNFNDFIII